MEAKSELFVEPAYLSAMQGARWAVSEGGLWGSSGYAAYRCVLQR